MPKVWLYVLLSVSKGKPWYYVGQTERLFQRMSEHANKTGSHATSLFRYKKLVGLYCIGDAEDTCRSERLIKENELTLQMMKLQDNPYRVRGGSWCSHGITQDFNPPIKKLKEICMPVICHCKLPAKKKFGNFVCALADASWINFNRDDWPMDSIEPCTFNVNEIFVKNEAEPNYCLVCEVPCGNFSTCFSCKKK
jgi:predicted GIY-YIG superfamily endonuclease